MRTSSQRSAIASTGRRIVFAAAVLLLAAPVAACSAGSGPLTSESRQVPAFTRLEVTGGIGVTLRIGAAQPVEVRAQQNILPLIATDVADGTLRIRSTRSYTSTEGVDVTIVAPTLEGLTMNGGSGAQIEGLDVAQLTIELSGGSRVTASGSSGALVLSASGGSRATLQDLSNKTVTLDLSGGSVAMVRASDTVSGSASGGSKATVLGDATVNVSVTGGSEATSE